MVCVVYTYEPMFYGGKGIIYVNLGLHVGLSPDRGFKAGLLCYDTKELL